MTQEAQQALRLRTSSEEATLDLGRTLGTAILEAIPLKTSPGVTVLLSGDLGTGKTTLVRGIGDALGAMRVRSPSFTLINEYHTTSLSIVHADLYRLKSGMAGGLGLEEYHDAPCVLLIEWPERWAGLAKCDALKIFIESRSENERDFEISSKGEVADLLLQNLRNARNDKNGKFDSGAGLQFTLD